MEETQATQTESGVSFFDLISRSEVGVFLFKLLLAIVVVGLLVLLSRFFSKFISTRLRDNSIGNDEYTKKISSLVGEIIFYTLFVVSLLIGLTIVGIDFGWILGGISFGIGFAFKDILGNMFAGIMVLTNKEFKLGDIIQIEDEQEYFGRVEEITIRYTVIRTFDLRKVIIPNLTLITKPVRTYDSEEVIRLDTVFTVHYGTDIEKASLLIKEAVNSVEYVKEKDSTRVSCMKFAESGVDMLVYFYFDPKNGMLIQAAKSGVHKAIFEMFKKEGIVIPYPHTTLTVDYNDKNLLGSMLYVANHSNDHHKGD